MNYRGSYRRLRDNATSALLASIEVYNKPRFAYCDEVVVILLLNAWELLLKAVISKSGQRIFYRKKRGQPYRSLSLDDSMAKAKNANSWPASVPALSVQENLAALTTYRDNAVHFYNEPGFGAIIYSLVQTAILNFRDVLSDSFGTELASEITWYVLPLGVRAPVDPVQFLRGQGSEGENRSVPVTEFLAQLSDSAKRLEDEAIDTGRFLTIFDMRLQSTKKIKSSQIVVGVSGAEESEAVIVTTKLDPNRSHPWRQREVLAHLSDRPLLNAFGWQAVAWKLCLRDKPVYCWTDETSGLVKWSPEVAAVVRQLSDDEVIRMRKEYSAHLKARQRQSA